MVNNQIAFNKENMTYEFGDTKISMKVAVLLADFIIGTLTKDENFTYVKSNMKPEYIDIYHNHLEGSDIKE